MKDAEQQLPDIPCGRLVIAIVDHVTSAGIHEWSGVVDLVLIPMMWIRKEYGWYRIGLDLGDGIRAGSGDGHGSGAPGKAHLMNERFHNRVYAGGIIGFLEFISRMLSTEMDDLKRLELFGVAPDET